MMFPTTINGIPCQALVTELSPYRPMLITGCGYGDALPPEEAEYEVLLYDRKGYRAKWLDEYLTSEEGSRIVQEYLEYFDELEEELLA